jgi:hypothetical protein
MFTNAREQWRCAMETAARLALVGGIGKSRRSTFFVPAGPPCDRIGCG